MKPTRQGRLAPLTPEHPGSISAISPSPLLELIAKLEKFCASKGVEAYLVGGIVRDALLGRPTRDIDLAVAADAVMLGRQLAVSLVGRFVPLDEKRGIVRVVVPSSEGAWFVDLSSFRDGLTGDLRGRDFTLDALAVSLADAADGNPWSNVIDPLGGLPDLRDGLIRAVGPSVFREDPARLMRAPRLAAQLRFVISPETAAQIRRDAHLVASVAPERIRDELLMTIAEPQTSDWLRLLDELGVLCQVIPELEAARGVTQPKEHHWDVFGHLVETAGQVGTILQDSSSHNGIVADSVPQFASLDEHFAQEVSDGHSRLTLLKLAGLLHDVAKPATRKVDAAGRIRFIGHDREGAEMVERILRRLRLSGRGVELARLMVEHHLRPSQMAQPGELPTGKAIYRYYRDLGDAAIDTLYLNLADYLAARGPRLHQREWSEYCRVVGHILQEGLERKAPESLPKLISGQDIMEVFSLNPGPRVGLLLGLVREAQASGEIKTRGEALELVKANLDSGGGSAEIR